MRTAELALASAVIIGCVFKVQHWPGAGPLIVGGGSGLALFYLLFGFRTLPAPKPTDQILWMTVLGGASMSAALSGLVAFLQRWPLNKELMVGGAISCAASLIAAFVLRYKHPRLDIYLDGLIVRCMALGGLAITLWTLFAGKPR